MGLNVTQEGDIENKSQNCLTEAQQDRAKQWDNYPAQLGDLMQSAWHGLGDQPQWWAFRASFPSKEWPQLLVTGKESPGAKTENYSDGSVLITITDGLIRFLQNTCAALFAVSQFKKAGGSVSEAAAMDLSSADDLLLRAYSQWAETKQSEMPPPLSFEVGPQAAEMTRAHLVLALLFVVLHEFGHATLHRGLKHEAALELEADRWAIEKLLEMDGRPGIEQNLVISGAVISVRAFAALDRLGLFYLGDYPTPTTRFKEILQVFRKRIPDEISFYLASTYPYTLDFRMEEAEHALRRSMPRRDQILSHTVSLLAEMYHKRMTLPEAVKIAKRTFSESWRLPYQVLDGAKIFASDQPSYAEDSDWGKMVRFVIDNGPALQAMLKE